MAKKTTKKSNPKNEAKMKAFAILNDALASDYKIFDNDDFTAKLTASTFIVDIDGVDVRVVLSVPNGDSTNLRYEREEDLDEEEFEESDEEEE